MSLDTASLRLSGSKLTADLDAAVIGLGIEYGTGTVAALTVTVLDDELALANSPLLTPGSTVTWNSDPWQVGGRTTRWGSDATVQYEFACRSTLARKLRKAYKASAEKKVSPSEWVVRRVTAAGGTAVCQPSAKQATIAQTSGSDRQSELDVIANLASDQEWSWVEWGGRLYFGSRHWAWQTGPTGRLWSVTWGTNESTDALDGEITVDDDDTDNVAHGTLSVPYPYGILIRPWDRIKATGFGRDAGTYLVEQVTITADAVTPVQLQIAQPRPPAKKSGSSK